MCVGICGLGFLLFQFKIIGLQEVTSVVPYGGRRGCRYSAPLTVGGVLDRAFRRVER